MQRTAFTLIELVVSLSIASILLAGMISALFLATRARPADTRPAYVKVSTETGTAPFYVDDIIFRVAGTGADAELTPVPGSFRRETLR